METLSFHFFSEKNNLRKYSWNVCFFFTQILKSTNYCEEPYLSLKYVPDKAPATPPTTPPTMPLAPSTPNIFDIIVTRTAVIDVIMIIGIYFFINAPKAGWISLKLY